MIDTSVLAPFMTAAALGVAAGLAVAIPLGPIGLLIVDRGMRHGRAVGLAAAAGVAVTDLVYAVLALTATAWAVRLVEPVTVPATYLAAVVIAAIGVRGLLQARRPQDDDHLDHVAEKTVPRPARTFVGFVALTAINPATVLYFTGLSLALVGRVGSLGTRLALLAGIGLGSLAWRSALAWFGAHIGHRPRPSLQRRTHQIGSLVLLAFAAALAANAT